MDIPSLDLTYNGQQVGFALKKMEEIYLQTKGEKGVPHRHNYYTVLWARNACGKHQIDYKEYLIKPNIVFFVSPGQVHNVITKPYPQGWVILFTRGFLQQNYISEDFIKNIGLFSDITDTPPLVINEETEKRLVEIAQHLGNTFKEDNPFKLDVIASYLKLFLVECNRLADEKTSQSNHTLQAGRLILKNFKELLDKKFSEWHRVSYFAEALSISPDYLNNVVKSSTGKTAKGFIQERILLEAKRLGLHTEMSSKQIAYQLGFDDPSYFSKFYKNIEGRSFRDFRLQLNKEILSI